MFPGRATFDSGVRCFRRHHLTRVDVSETFNADQHWFRITSGLFQRCSLPENLWTALISSETELVDQRWCFLCSLNQHRKTSKLWNSPVQRWLPLGLQPGQFFKTKTRQPCYPWHSIFSVFIIFYPFSVWLFIWLIWVFVADESMIWYFAPGIFFFHLLIASNWQKETWWGQTVDYPSRAWVEFSFVFVSCSIFFTTFQMMHPKFYMDKSLTTPGNKIWEQTGNFQIFQNFPCRR